MKKLFLALAVLLALDPVAFAQNVGGVTLSQTPSWSKGAPCTLASATTTDIGTCLQGLIVSITGTVTITSLGSTAPAGSSYRLYFTGSLILTNGASLNIAGNASLTTVANSSIDCYVPVTAGTWYCGLLLYNTGVFTTPAGGLTANRFIVTGSTVPANGVYLPAANTTGITANTTLAGSFTTTAFTTPFGIVNHVRLPTDAASVAVVATDYYVGIITTTQAVGVSLYATPTAGQTFTICDISNNGATRNITLTPAAGNIDAAATYVITTNSGCWTGFYTGVIWKTVSSR